MNTVRDNEEKLSSWLPEAWLYLALAVALGTFALENVDTGWHLLMGEWVRHNGLLHENVFSFVNAGHPYLADKWLFQVVLSFAHDLFQVKGMVLLRLLFVLGLASVMFRAAGRAARSVPGALVLGIALLAASPRFLLRPDFVTLLFLAWHMRWVLMTPPPGRAAWMWALALQMLWTNLHGYFVMGPLLWAAVLAGRLAMRALGRPNANLKAPLGFLVACTVGSFVHAYGLTGTLNPIRLLRGLSEHSEIYARAIPELRPTFAAHWLPGPLLAFGTLTAAVTLLMIWRNRRMDFGAAMVLLMTFAQSIGVMRNVGLFAVVAGPWLLVEGRALFAELPRRRVTPVLLGLRPLVILLLVLMTVWQVTGKTAVSNRTSRFAGLGLNVDVYPIEEAKFLAEHDLTERVAAPFEWGGYLLWRMRPASGVLIDGNTDGYPVEHLDWCWRLFAGVEDPWLARKQYAFGAFLTPWNTGLARRLWRDQRFVPVFAGRVGLVFLAADDVSDELRDRDLHDAVAEGWVPPVGQHTKWWRGVYPRPLLDTLGFFVDLQLRPMVARMEKRLPRASARLPEVEMLRAARQELLGHRKVALNLIDRVCQKWPDLAPARELRAAILADQGMGPLARSDLLAAVKEEPHHPDWWLTLGELQDSLGDHRSALMSLRRAAALAPASLAHVRPLVQRLKTSSLVQDQEEAEEWTARLLAQALSDFDRAEAERLAGL